MDGKKEIQIKSCTYYFFDDMINAEVLDPNKINIDEKFIQKCSYYLH